MRIDDGFVENGFFLLLLPIDKVVDKDFVGIGVVWPTSMSVSFDS